MNCFIGGFVAVGNIVLAVAGGLLALVVTAVCMGALILITARLFDAVTSWVTASWRRSGKKPKYRWQRILMRADADEPV